MRTANTKTAPRNLIANLKNERNYVGGPPLAMHTYPQNQQCTYNKRIQPRRIEYLFIRYPKQNRYPAKEGIREFG
jgi:hypothetical protein